MCPLGNKITMWIQYNIWVDFWRFEIIWKVIHPTMRVKSYLFYNLSHARFNHFFYLYSLYLVINNFVEKSLSLFCPNLRRKHLSRYFPLKASFFFIFLNIIIDLKKFGSNFRNKDIIASIDKFRFQTNRGSNRGWGVHQIEP